MARVSWLPVPPIPPAIPLGSNGIWKPSSHVACCLSPVSRLGLIASRVPALDHAARQHRRRSERDGGGLRARASIAATTSRSGRVTCGAHLPCTNLLRQLRHAPARLSGVLHASDKRVRAARPGGSSRLRATGTFSARTPFHTRWRHARTQQRGRLMAVSIVMSVPSGHRNQRTQESPPAPVMRSRPTARPAQAHPSRSGIDSQASRSSRLSRRRTTA
jgi:hypothetical protein